MKAAKVFRHPVARVGLVCGLGACALYACMQWVPMLAAQAAPAPIRLNLPQTGKWRCPPTQDCSARSTSMDYVLGSPQVSLYLSFSGELKAPLSLPSLQKNFRYLDLYLRDDEQGERWKLVGAGIDNRSEGRVRFEQVGAHWMRLRLSARAYRLRTEKRGEDAACADKDVGGCSSEKRIEQAMELELVVPLAAFPSAPAFP